MGTQRDLPPLQQLIDQERSLKIMAVLDKINPPSPEESARRQKIMEWNEANPNNKKPIAQIEHWGKIGEPEPGEAGALTEMWQRIGGGFGMPPKEQMIGRHDTRPPPPKVQETEQQRMKRIAREDAGVPERRNIRQELWPHDPGLENPQRAKVITEYQAMDPDARDAYRKKHFDNYQWPRGGNVDLYRSMTE